jgi:hypothetical protein
MNFGKVLDSSVYTDETYSWRWLDAWGDVTKFLSTSGFAVDDTTGDPTQFTTTVVEAGTGTNVVSNDVTGNNWMLETTAANEYDGVNLQLLGEAFKIATNKPFYFGCKLSVSDATQSDLFIGLAETDTTLMATSSAHAIALGGDGCFFSKLDGSTTVAAKTYLDGAQVGTANATTALNTSKHTYEIYFDGEYVNYYFDAVLVTKTKTSLPDGAMTPSFNFRAGAAAAKTCTIEWMRAIQVYS